MRSDRDYVKDVLDAIEKIEEFVKSMDYDEFVELNDKIDLEKPYLKLGELTRGYGLCFVGVVVNGNGVNHTMGKSISMETRYL